MSDLHLPIIIRHGSYNYHYPTLRLTAQAMGLFFGDDRFHDTWWTQGIEDWADDQSTKIARRATPKKWEKVKEQAVILVEDERAGVAVCLPATRKTVDPLIGKLPISGTNYSRMFSQPSEVSEGTSPVVHLAPNPDIPMTTGKMVAQVGHAIQYLYLYDPEGLKAWVDNGAHVRIKGWGDIPFDDEAILVRDSGKTEIEAGSATVKIRLEKNG